MYNTVKELHIALDERLQQLNSNRKLVLYPEQKDARLNEATLQFVHNVISKVSNTKKEGFQDTEKRYDDIEELIRTTVLDVYINDTDNVIAPLPYDYLHLVSDRSKLSHDCTGISYDTPIVDTTTVAVIPFTIAVAGTPPYYTSFNINVNGLSIYASPITSNSIEGRFMIINSALETINNGGVYEAYWEQYLDNYEKNSFIIVVPTGTLTSTITYAAVTINGVIKNYTYNTYPVAQSFPSPINKSNELLSAEVTYDTIDNYYGNKNRHLKPISNIQQGFLKVYYNDTFIIKEVQINYIKRPRLINLELNQTCELNSGEEIVAIAVQNIMADKTNQYEYFANERSIKE